MICSWLYDQREPLCSSSTSWGLGHLYITTWLLPNQVLKTKNTQHKSPFWKFCQLTSPSKIQPLVCTASTQTPANEDKIFPVHSQLEAVASKVKFKYLILLKLLLHIVAKSAETQILNRYESWLIWLLNCTLVIYVTQKQVILLLNSLRNMKEKNFQCILVL